MKENTVLHTIRLNDIERDEEIYAQMILTYISKQIDTGHG
jgi:hypothetical protein